MESDKNRPKVPLLEPPPPSIPPGSFVRLREEWEELTHDPGSRLSDRVEFVYGTEAREKFLEELADDLANANVKVYKGGLGRGATGPAVVLQAYEIVTNVLTDVAAWVTAGAGVAGLWKRLVRRKGPPVLSLGAVKLLCAIELSQTVEDMSDVRCVYAGDIGGGLAEDVGHTGEDLFMVMFERPGQSWIYVVTSRGEVVYRTGGQRLSDSFLLDLKASG